MSTAATHSTAPAHPSAAQHCSPPSATPTLRVGTGRPVIGWGYDEHEDYADQSWRDRWSDPISADVDHPDVDELKRRERRSLAHATGDPFPAELLETVTPLPARGIALQGDGR